MGTIILFVIILSILVVVHEFGHFITARKSGMRVYEFGVGFPPRAIGFYTDPKTGKRVWVKGSKKGRLSNTVGGKETQEEEEYPATVYSLNWLPLGGFVKIKGENGEQSHDPDSFGYHKAWKKFTVLVAGVVMNILFAGVLLAVGFMIGLPADFSQGVDSKAIVLEESGVMIQQVVKNSPAEVAGLQFGDKVLSINSEAVEGSTQFIEKIKANGENEITLTVNRVDEEKQITLTPELKGDIPQIGVALVDAGVIRYPWYIAFYKGFVAAFFGLINIFIAFYFLIKGLIFGQGLAFDVAGPVGIAVFIGDSARLGINYLINVAAMISLSLAAINILPIPALDGGRALFVVIEKVIGRKLPLKYEQVAHTVGFVLLMLLIVIITGRDIINLF